MHYRQPIHVREKTFVKFAKNHDTCKEVVPVDFRCVESYKLPGSNVIQNNHLRQPSDFTFRFIQALFLKSGCCMVVSRISPCCY